MRDVGKNENQGPEIDNNNSICISSYFCTEFKQGLVVKSSAKQTNKTNSDGGYSQNVKFSSR